MPLDVKICGLTSADAVDAAVTGGAAFTGFVFVEKSPRFVTPETAAALAARVPPPIGRIGVFVDPDDTLIDSVLAAVKLTALQLHGRETPRRVAALRARTGLGIWRALPVHEAGDLARTRLFDRGAGAVDRFLFDARPPAAASRTGGHGRTFDWRLLRDLKTTRPWLLAGGLTARNLAEAVATSGAKGVDVSSGVEDRPGHKDPGRVAEFLAAAAMIRAGK